MALSSALTVNNLPKSVSKIAAVTATILCAWFVASLCGLLVDRWIPMAMPSRLAMRSSMANPKNFASNDTIVQRNLFGLSTSNEVNLNTDPVRTAMNITLMGTVIFKDPMKSLAAIQDNGETKLYPVRQGDDIPGKFQILGVEASKVIFINASNRRKEFIDLPADNIAPISRTEVSKPSAGIQKASDSKFTVSRSELQSQLANFETLIREAKAEPEFAGGMFRGFRLKEIKPGSFYEKIGLKLMDLIISVNGEKITDVARALALLNDLNSMDSLKLGINRNGKDQVMSYDIQ